MSEPQYGSVPFQEAIDHFRGKLNLPTEYWDQIAGETNAKAFTVAGATKLDLLKDIRAAVDDAIANGTTITDFRKQFDEAVAKHGWSYKGTRGWRTRIIYDTNLRTAHAAGAWQQAQRTKKRRPYLQYMTAGDSRVRPQHAMWDGTVLPIDDAWWSTHYPPNGWGCRCTVRTLSQRQMEQEGLVVSNAPALDPTERINVVSGEVYGDVPKGIDVGWDYNVGKAWLGPDIAFGEAVMQMPVDLRTTALANASDLVPHLTNDFSPWANSLLTRKRPLGEIKTVGYLSPSSVDGLVARGKAPTTAVITITDKDVMHMLRDAKDGRHIPADMVRALPEFLDKPEAVLYDKRDHSLLYVFSTPGEDRRSKLVMKVNYKIKARTTGGGRHSAQTNAISPGGLVELRNLKDANFYELVEGKI
ncbi:MAG: minor capsid protein [Gammaproteobacteria bacterium]|nr:minor capsid protein [Gammaproteobacteria bacterium]